MFFLNKLYITLILIVLAALFYFLRQKRPSMRYSNTALVEALPKTWKSRIAPYLYILDLLALVLIVLALMRLQSPVESSKIESEGIDIVMAIDCSGSMLAEDFISSGKRHNRLAAVKRVVETFVKARHSDRLGLVAFAGRAYTACPLTLDYAWMIDNLQRLEIGIIEEDGTAIGSAIASSLQRLKNSDAKSKVIILLTDGRSNAGTVDPLEAAKMAKAMGVKVYTIGAGKKGTAPFPARDFFGNKVYRQVAVDIDEVTLREIASHTNANYYRATDMNSLKEIYAEIDELETTEIEEEGYAEYKELFPIFLIPALMLLILHTILINTLFRRLP